MLTRLSVSLVPITLLVFMLPVVAFGQNENNGSFGDFEIGIPGSNEGSADAGSSIDSFIEGTDTPLITFVSIIINFITALIVIIGVISIVVGGYIYMTAGGDSSRVGLAKVWIGSALLGIALALTAFVILNTIGPQFAEDIKEPVINVPPPPQN